MSRSPGLPFLSSSLLLALSLQAMLIINLIAVGPVSGDLLKMEACPFLIAAPHVARQPLSPAVSGAVAIT